MDTDINSHADETVMESYASIPLDEKGQMTQGTDKCPNRQLYTDIPAWITDAKILSVFARTGHRGQYEGHKSAF